MLCISLNNVPKMPPGKLVYGSPKKNGACEFDQLEASNPGNRHALTGSDASFVPLTKRQKLLDWMRMTRVSRVKLHLALVFVPLKALGVSARSKMP